MSLEKLQAVEERVRNKLDDVRGQLARIVLIIRSATNAERELETLRTATKGKGVYRDAVAERIADLKSKVHAAKLAGPQRERLRRQETSLFIQLEQTRRDIEACGIRRNVVPVLDGIPLAEPCPVRWDEMAGDANARLCPRCKLTVYHVATLDPQEATRLLSTAGADAQLHRRADGTILARDCPVGSSHRRFERWAPVGAVAALVLVALMVRAYARALRPVAGAPSDTNYGEFMPPVAPRLHDATSLHVVDSQDTLGGRYRAEITLKREGDHFTHSFTCSTFDRSLSRSGHVPAAVVELFLDAVNARPIEPDARVTYCVHTDDYPKIDVTVTTPSHSASLAVLNCSRQWFVNGLVLDSEWGTGEVQHRSINTAYGAMLDGIGVRKCFDDVEKLPPP